MASPIPYGRPQHPGPRGAARLIPLATLLLVHLASLRGTAAEARVEEYQVKAVFLSKFASFVTWPDTAFPAAEAPIIIGVYGQDPFGAYLREAVDGVVIGGRGVAVRPVADVEAAGACHILFINEPAADRRAALIAALATKPVLTVGDVTGFAKAGGIVNFTLKRNRVSLEINPGAAAKAGLEIKTKLLSIATVVP